MNKVCLTGRSTKEWELKSTQGGTSVVKNSIAVQRDMKNASGEYESDFINVTVWGKTAEFICNHTSKGKLVEIEGRIQTGSYEKDGQRVYTTEIMVDKIKPIEWVKNNGQPQQQVIQEEEEMTPVEDGEIPF